MKNIIKVGSDFSGVGAFNQALMRLGIEYDEVFACDMDKYARQTFIHNYGEPKYYPTNVYDREIPKDSLDIYMTSPPCQAFSLAGKRLGKGDKRGILFFNSLEFIQVNKPRYFIFENVKGLLSDDNGNTFSEWVNLLGGKSVNGNAVMFPYEDAVPYHLYWKVLNAKHYGVPQNRERVFLVGIRDDKDNSFTWPVEEQLKTKLKDVLEDNVSEKYFLSDKMQKFVLNTKFKEAKPIDIDKQIAPCVKVGGDVSCFDTNKLNKIGYINQDTQASAVYDENGISQIMTAGTHGYAMEYIQIKSATSKGYEEATEGDSINLSVPNSETRRGRFGKGVAQTLDTSCNQGVMVLKEVRTDDAKKTRKEKGSNNFRDKEIEAREQEYMNTISTSQTKDNLLLIGDYRTDEGFRWRQDGNSPAIMAMMRDTWKENFTGQNPPIISMDYKIRRLTPRECFRLMDFPDTFTWPVSDSQAYKQAGNSIVVRVLAKIIEKLIFYGSK